MVITFYWRHSVAISLASHAFKDMMRLRNDSGIVSSFKTVCIPTCKASWILVLFIFSSLLEESLGAFRFCRKGVWHELQEKDCPYGLLFKEILHTPCYYSEGPENTTPVIWSSVCESPFANKQGESDKAFVGTDFMLAQRNGQIQMVQYGFNSSVANASIGEDFVDIYTCMDECYLSIEGEVDPDLGQVVVPPASHEEGDSVEHFLAGSSSFEALHVDDTNTVVGETDKMAITDQTLRLGDFLFDELQTEERNRLQQFEQTPDPGPAAPNLRIVQLFKKSIKILGKTCPHPFMPEDFRNRILSGFLFLVQDTGIGEVDDISMEDFEDIADALKSCEAQYPRFRLEGTVCSMKTIATEVIKILPGGEEHSAVYRPASWNRNLTRFPYNKLDPFVEFAWQAVTVVHGNCFSNFIRNPNVHHKYTAAMEKLFGAKIRFRWEHPTILEDIRMWGTWFLADVDSTYLNMGACISGAYLGAPFSTKLDRPIDPNRRSGRRRRAAGTENDGSLGAIKAYWDDYKRSGGLPTALSQDSVVHCFKSEADRDTTFQALLTTQCANSPEVSTKSTN